jgi:hypothetical protein
MTTKRGRHVVRSNGRPFARTQWENWSPPGWFNDAEFEQTAKSFENPDWPEIPCHSYGVRWGEADKDPGYADLDRLVTAAQSIATPTIMIQGASDAVTLPNTTEAKTNILLAAVRDTSKVGNKIAIMDRVGGFRQPSKSK